jgi:hydroxyacylglutathione hydrolase
VIIEQFAAGPWATNCYVVAPEVNSEAIIIDPGFDSLAEIQSRLARHQLHPVAALLTHGHMDHVWSVVPLCKSHNLPAWIHEKDEWMIKEPIRAYPNESWQQILQMADHKVNFYPHNINLIRQNQKIDIAGMDLTTIHSPGHTMGSLMFQIEKTLFSGDTLFNQGIGRTDLPGGDEGSMRRTLKEVILPMDDEIRVYPGHGPRTTIKDERLNNIYLRELTK